jgi:phosphoadenosine phosphosulfate reductase
MLPLRHVRYCCQYLKESAGAGTCTLLGIRAAESSRRAKRNECEINNKKYSNTLDQFNIDKESGHICMKGKDKLLISPIFFWTDRDIWQFIRENNMPYCKLYDNGYRRIGCMFCPMADKKTKTLDRKNYPGVEKAIKKSIQYLIDTFNFADKYNAPADEVFDWWISNKTTNDYFRNLRTQTKLDL